jgi:dihydroorotate dehydrogenase (NAD+) catalytic subunit
MEFLVAGASAVQIGTANFYNPTATMTILDALPAAVAELGAVRIVDIVGTIKRPSPASPVVPLSPKPQSTSKTH